MIRTLHLFIAFVGFVVAPVTAKAGWVVEWKETAVKPNGDRLDPQASTMTISKGMARIAQPQTTTLLDYGKQTFAILNSTQGYFWSGTVDEYLRQMVKDRSATLHQRMGPQADDLSFELRDVDAAKLPAIAIEKTADTDTIAGYAATKYEIKAGGELLLEAWLAEGLNLSMDLEPKEFVEYEGKLSRGMLGNTANAFTALYKSDEYRKLLERGYVVKSVTHHGAGSYERTATQVREEEVPATTFEVPDSYRRVRLADVLAAPSS